MALAPKPLKENLKSPGPSPAAVAPALVIELDDDQLIAHACHVLEQRLKYRTDRTGGCLESPDAVRKLLRLRFSEREHEVFAVLFLDNRHRLIEIEEMFRGTWPEAEAYLQQEHPPAVLFAGTQAEYEEWRQSTRGEDWSQLRRAPIAVMAGSVLIAAIGIWPSRHQRGL